MTLVINILKIIALAAISGVFLKAVIDVDGSWDTWMYHLPYAARLWGFSTPSDYLMHYGLEERFEGFPLLAEYLQGLFWLISQRPESANLVGFFSLLLYIWFLKRYLNIPLYLSTLILLAIPLVQIHAVSCYIDLPANIAVSMLVILCYLLYTRENFANRFNILLMILVAACAVNMRFVLTPLTFIMVSLIMLRLFSLESQNPVITKSYRPLILFPALMIALLTIFATPIKNVIVHGNPAYPVIMTVAGVTLNHKHEATEVVPPYLEQAPRAQRWLHSVLEVETYPFTHQLHWSIDQYFPPHFGNRLGGYFAAYVVFNVLLLLYLTYRLHSRESWIIFLSIIGLTGFTAIMPQSLELRYYLYWMLILVSSNAYLVMKIHATMPNNQWIHPATLGSVAATAMLTVILVTRGMYVYPSFFTFKDLHQEQVDPKIINMLHTQKGQFCFHRAPWTFLYSAIFNPPLDYAIREGKEWEKSEKECGNYQLPSEWLKSAGN